MVEEFVISKMTKADIKDVMELGFIASDFVHNPYTPRFYDVPTLERLIKSPHILYVARLKGDLAGFSFTTFDKYTRDGEVRVLEESDKDKGALNLLLEKTFDELETRGCKIVIGWRRLNTPGLKMLQDAGFHVGKSHQLMEHTFTSS